MLNDMNENFREQAEATLAALGLFLGLDDLEFNEEDDTCILQLDETTRVNITLNTENNTLVLHSLMGTLPQDNRSEVVEQLLEANLFWSGTNGATISIERETGLVIIARALRLAANGNLLTGEALATAIAELASAAGTWKKLLENQDIETESPEATSSQAQEPEFKEPIDITRFD